MSEAERYQRLSRAIDFAAALCGLVVLAPCLGLIAVAVAGASGLPVLYRGVRVGRGGRPFRMLKFRTMVRDAERRGTSVTHDGDPRVTAIGEFLRRWKLDELPQLWNVLQGEMALVGPRPDAPEIIQTYSAPMREALEVRPGVTSVASLWLRNETELLRGVRSPDAVYERILVPAKVELALEHVRRRSIAFDWGILLATAGSWAGVRREDPAERRFLEALRLRIADADADAGADAASTNAPPARPSAAPEEQGHAGSGRG